MSLFSTCKQKHAARTRDGITRKLVKSHFSFRYVNCAMQRKKYIKICAHTKRQWNWPLRPNRLIWKRIKYDQNISQKKIVRLSFFISTQKGKIFPKLLPIGIGTCAANKRRWIPCDNTFYYTYSTSVCTMINIQPKSLVFLLLLLLRNILFSVFVFFFLLLLKSIDFNVLFDTFLVAHLSTTKQYQFITHYRLQENVSSLPISSALPYGLNHCEHRWL